MKKIIWISSYPKSGNTWMRYLIANYFFNNKMEFDPHIIRYIDGINYSEEISKKNKNNKLDVRNISKFWIPAQENFKVQDGQVAFIKNHNANLTIDGKDFTNEKYSVAVIYIVRDPRDMIVSGYHYFGSNYDKLIYDICNQEFFTIHNNSGNVQVLSTWDEHFKSWINKMPNLPKILIKYEDLIHNTENVFRNTILFLSKILKFQMNEKKIEFSIQNSNFKKLSKMENEIGFAENISGNKFFRKGEVGQYIHALTKKQISTINKRFEKEMKFLKYL